MATTNDTISIAWREAPDALSTLLGRIRVRGNVYARPVACGDWMVEPKGAGQASYHLLTAGSCWLHVPGRRDPLALAAGDVVFFPRDIPHRLSPAPTPPEGEPRLPERTGGAETHLVCGIYASEDQELQRLIRGLPDVILAKAEGKDTMLARTILLLMASASDTGPGAKMVMDALSDALLSLLLREAIATCHVEQGLLGGLGDPRLAPALSALHSDPGRAWSVESLAEVAALSRSAFAERFQRVMQTTPAAYLSEVRMQEARALLRDTDLSVAIIAERLGYATEAAFRRAYRRVVGRTPGTDRRGR